jgi:hypothetical protein
VPRSLPVILVNQLDRRWLPFLPLFSHPFILDPIGSAAAWHKLKVTAGEFRERELTSSRS